MDRRYWHLTVQLALKDFKIRYTHSVLGYAWSVVNPLIFSLVYFLVFSVFITTSFDLLKQFGVGLAAAVLIDATIIRAVLLPASMKLLGDWNWYLPKWLEWLPHLDAGDTVEKPKPTKTPPALGPTS